MERITITTPQARDDLRARKTLHVLGLGWSHVFVDSATGTASALLPSGEYEFAAWCRSPAATAELLELGKVQARITASGPVEIPLAGASRHW